MKTKPRKYRDMEALALILRGRREQPHRDRRNEKNRRACRDWREV